MTKTFSCEVTIKYNGRTANAKSIMGLASLAAEFGSTVFLEAEGSDAEPALEKLVNLIEIELATPENNE